MNTNTNRATRGTIRLHLHLTHEEAEALAQAVKRINRNNLTEPMTISAKWEEAHAEDAFRNLGRALNAAGYDPR